MCDDSLVPNQLWRSYQLAGSAIANKLVGDNWCFCNPNLDAPWCSRNFQPKCLISETHFIGIFVSLITVGNALSQVLWLGKLYIVKVTRYLYLDNGLIDTATNQQYNRYINTTKRNQLNKKKTSSKMSKAIPWRSMAISTIKFVACKPLAGQQGWFKAGVSSRSTANWRQVEPAGLLYLNIVKHMEVLPEV